MSTNPDPDCLFTVEAGADPRVPGRILYVLSLHNQVPDWFSARRRGAKAVSVTIELCGVADEVSAFLAGEIERIPGVHGVSWSHLPRSAPSIPDRNVAA